MQHFQNRSFIEVTTKYLFRTSFKSTHSIIWLNYAKVMWCCVKTAKNTAHQHQIGYQQKQTAADDGRVAVESIDEHASDILKRQTALNNVMCFIQNKYHNHTVSNKIDDTGILSWRKKLLLQSRLLLQTMSDKSLIAGLQQFAKRRIGENKIKITVDDVLIMWSTIDEKVHLMHYLYRKRWLTPI